ncbi:hypothetical protein AB0M34_25330 [Nocardia sp. NPDC050193]
MGRFDEEAQGLGTVAARHAPVTNLEVRMLDGGDGGGGTPTERIGPIVPATDKDPWKKVSEQAAAGKLVFEPIAAQTAAEECADAIGRILGLQKTITDTDSLGPLSQLVSGGLLATQFNNTLRGLNDVLGSHKTVLTEMMGTFKAAGKKYIDTELDSAYGFDKQTRAKMKEALDAVKPPTQAGAFLESAPKKGKAAKSERQDDSGEVAPLGTRDFTDFGKDTKDPPAGLSKIEAQELIRPAVFKDNMADFMGENQSQPQSLTQWRLETGAHPENPDAQEWADLYELGVSTGKVSKQVNLAGQLWNWMAEEMDDAVGTFAEKLAKMPDSLWSGEGRDGAIGAVNDYHKKAGDLTSRMKSFGSNLDYTSKWLENTKKGMPQDRKPPEAEVTYYSDENGSYETTDHAGQDAENRRNLAIYRQNMENNYVQGVQISSQFIPAFNDLPTTLKDEPGDSPKGKEEQAGEGGGARPNYGGGTGPAFGGGATPSLTGAAAPSLGGGMAPGYSGGGYDAAAARTAATPPTIDSANYNGRSANGVDSSTDPSIPEQYPTNPGTGALDGLGQAAGLAGQGLSGAQAAAQQAAEAARQAASLGPAPNMPKPGDLPRVGSPGSPGGGPKAGSIGAGGSSPAPPMVRPETETARLFPRASLAGPAASTPARMMSMPASGMPMGGTPGTPGAGAGAGNQGQQEKEHKRPTYLNSKEHLEEALGEARTVTKAVVEQ